MFLKSAANFGQSVMKILDNLNLFVVWMMKILDNLNLFIVWMNKIFGFKKKFIMRTNTF